MKQNEQKNPKLQNMALTPGNPFQILLLNVVTLPHYYN